MNQTAARSQAHTLWDIAEIERDTGLGKDTLRVWERRYGFPTPLRDTRGDRLYDPPQLERLLRIKRLLDLGHRAGKVVPLALPALEHLLQTSCQAADPPDAAALDDWLERLKHGKPAELRVALQQELRQLGLSRAIEQLLAPLGQRIGQAWLAGQLSIHQEHLFTETLQSVLHEAITRLDDSHPEPSQPPRVLLTTLPQEQHQLGLLMAECYFALGRCERIALGPRLPASEILAAVGHFRIDIVALSISLHASTREIAEQLALLREQLPPEVELWIGGGWAGIGRRHRPGGVQCVVNDEQVSAGLARWRAAHG
ncbi:MerR family transcriptional regulator [Malikia sp.]|uniref:MerR family transcriptional regulator n=1 Tax=Malikia sp. TaxID=2070706 RepID=UPI002637E00F|nr:MerR family transcriptional regulator [Malikia sp.]MDD2729187.1 MerR family transcriptional regulator [Malikia sp.]